MNNFVNWWQHEWGQCIRYGAPDGAWRGPWRRNCMPLSQAKSWRRQWREWWEDWELRQGMRAARHHLVERSQGGCHQQPKPHLWRAHQWHRGLAQVLKDILSAYEYGSTYVRLLEVIFSTLWTAVSKSTIISTLALASTIGLPDPLQCPSLGTPQSSTTPQCGRIQHLTSSLSLLVLGLLGPHVAGN